MKSLLDNSTSTAFSVPPQASDELILRNKRTDWLMEVIVYAVLIGICTFVVGAGLHYAIAGIGSRVVSTIFACAGLAVNYRVLCSAIGRYQFYQDLEPKLTLSKDSLCDHRTGLSVQLENVVGIRFDRRTADAKECRADLYLSMKDGSEHLFNLLQLDKSSTEIAWQVKNHTGIENADGVSEPKGIGLVGYAIGAVAVVGILWQIFINAKTLFAG